MIITYCLSAVVYLSAKHETLIQDTLSTLKNLAAYIMNKVPQINEKVFGCFVQFGFFWLFVWVF